MLFAYSGLRSNCLLSPPSAWGDTTQTRIGLREVALIGKAAGACNFGKRKPTVAQYSMRLINPMLEQPLVRRQTRRTPERASEMPGR